MADKPIIFSAPMIRALLDGRKTQTRRVIGNVPEMPSPDCHPAHMQRHSAPYLDAYCGAPKTSENPRGMGRDWHWWQVDDRPGRVAFRLPYAPGDRLWVREACATWIGDIRDVVYRADETDEEWANLRHDAKLGHWKLRPSIHMPRWASRLTLTVTDVRVQRLQEIRGEDCIAEGVSCETCAASWSVGRSACNQLGCFEIRQNFRDLWNSIHGRDAWAANPWVCALTFTVHRCNIDQMPGAANA